MIGAHGKHWPATRGERDREKERKKGNFCAYAADEELDARVIVDCISNWLVIILLIPNRLIQFYALRWMFEAFLSWLVMFCYCERQWWWISTQIILFRCFVFNLFFFCWYFRNLCRLYVLYLFNGNGSYNRLVIDNKNDSFTPPFTLCKIDFTWNLNLSWNSEVI